MPQRLRAVVLEGERRQGRLLAKGPAAAGSEGQQQQGQKAPQQKQQDPLDALMAAECAELSSLENLATNEGSTNKCMIHNNDPTKCVSSFITRVDGTYSLCLYNPDGKPGTGIGSDWRCYSGPDRLTCPGLTLPNLLAATKLCYAARWAPCGRRPAPVTTASPPPPPWYTVKSSPPRRRSRRGRQRPPSPPPPPPKPPKRCRRRRRCRATGRSAASGCAPKSGSPGGRDGVPVWCFKYNADEAACNNAYAKRVTGKYGWCFYEAGACKLVGDFDCPNLDLDATTTAPAPITTIAPATTTRFEIYFRRRRRCRRRRRGG